MPIDLGLSRITKLLNVLGNPHLFSNYVHVAGTNGKGSVCAYLSSLLIASSSNNRTKIGRFNSPHLIYRHDSVSVNDKPISLELFEKVENEIIRINNINNIQATEFEILTAVALQIFSLEKVDIALIEVGLGGRLDSTNVLKGAKIASDGQIIEKGVLATGITKIGKDHEKILGSTLAQIAFEKAGIIKHGIPNVVDGSNSPEVLKVVERSAKESSSENQVVESKTDEIHTSLGTIKRSLSPLKGDYQLQNLLVSLRIFDIIFPFLQKSYPTKFTFSLENVINGVKNTQWPGRLQSLQLKYSKSKPALQVLLDGAHNTQAASELHKYLQKTYDDDPIAFIIAVTEGKEVEPLFKQLIRPQDKVILTQFGPVDGMPWIKPSDLDTLKQTALTLNDNVSLITNLPEIFDTLSDNSNIVICGSLYLVGEVLRLHEANTIEIR